MPWYKYALLLFIKLNFVVDIKSSKMFARDSLYFIYMNNVLKLIYLGICIKSALMLFHKKIVQNCIYKL